MKLYGVEVVETVVKRTVLDANNLKEVINIISDMEKKDFDYSELLELKSSICLIDNEEEYPEFYDKDDVLKKLDR